MEIQVIHKRLDDWVNDLISEGKISFSLRQAIEAFPKLSEIAVKSSLKRLSVKGNVISIYKGYYLIIPPQYASRGILSPTMFLDAFMKFLKRPYYVGLLNAAAFYGAAHQQPQEFFVLTNFPVLRPTVKKGIKVNYISKSKILDEYLQNRKTETGYLKISSPELTAADLVQFEKRIGGLSRVATVLSELIEEMKPEKINKSFLKQIPATTIQRLGYLLEKVVKQKEMADHLYSESIKLNLRFLRIPLKASGKKSKKLPVDERWNVIVNIEIEMD
ncbi:MAG: hypothetical protein IT234_00815 [Bacteroidia bacterium]|nr:hypothetical protein [Bacteroidia bacterium]